MRWLLLSALSLAGCPSPPEEPKTGGIPGDAKGPGKAGGKASGKAPGKAGPPGEGAGDGPKSGDGPPGEAGDAPPPGDGDGGPPSGGRPTAEFGVEAGAGVAISGVVLYDGAAEGTLRVDFLTNDGENPMPSLVHSMTLEGPGPFSVEAPRGLGEVTLVAYIDAGDDGPSPGEPKGHLKAFEVKVAPIDGLKLQLSDDADKKKKDDD